ncbi:hypothetical protein GM3709_715 [Geminocystis sp. NIES-3709]|nr:hypothetical protein GM3709_715 [Geminocystis sp. NIES-3709]
MPVKFNLLEDEDIEQAEFIFSAIREYVNRNLQEKIDYGLIPNCGNKPVLFKAGAEKLCRLFKLRPTFEIIDRIVDYKENLFHYHYRCNLYRFGELVGMCDGIASSKESKFARALLICSSCGKEDTLMKSKYKDGYHWCNKNKGGCGENILSSTLDMGNETFNYNSINTLCKMAQKRALVGAVLIVCGASEYFTQDLED